jgi:hypothetical protein
VSVVFFSVQVLISAFSASRFLERAGAVAYSGRVGRSGAPMASAQRSQILPPAVAMLI